MKVIIFGGAGYLGGVLSSRLLDEGHQVTVFDNLRFGRTAVDPLEKNPAYKLIVGDIRDISAVSSAIKGQEAVLLLAALVGEAACDKDPDETVAINYLATMNVAKCAAYYGIRRFIFTSTDSCYGAQENVFLTEDSPLAPISLYAELKAKVEEELFSQNFPTDFKPTILRLATLYGLAPRMRFDLVINLLTREALVGSGAKIFSGEQWRPLVHVRDAAKAFALALTAAEENVAGRVFNVGSNGQNIQFKDLAGLIFGILPEARIETIPQPPDLRDYHVCFDRISHDLGFNPDYTVAQGIVEIKEALLDGSLGDPYSQLYRNS